MGFCETNGKDYFKLISKASLKYQENSKTITIFNAKDLILKDQHNKILYKMITDDHINVIKN